MFLPYNTIIVLAGVSLLGACAGLVGTFAVLRRRALVGDALAHAALPGLCVAFLVVGHRSLPAMLFGAFLTGVLGVAIVSGLRHATRIKEDAAIGIVLSVFYGTGIVLTRLIHNQTTTGSKAGLDSYILGKTAGMIQQDVILIAAVSAVCLTIVLLLFKELQVVVFDSSFASVQGWPSLLLDLLLMTMVAVTVVIGLPAVGVVMVAALLIIPAAAARFWTERLSVMLALASFFGALTGACGTLVSAHHNQLPAGPVIVLVGTGIFLISLFLSPQRGVIARTLRESAFRRRLSGQTALRLIYEFAEAELSQSQPVPVDDLLRRKSWNEKTLHRALAVLQRDGLIRTDSDGVVLTADGWRRAAEVTRLHRIWELFLSEHADSAGNFADLDSGTLKDRLPREFMEQLESRLKESGRWPLVPEDLHGTDQAT